MKTLMKDSIRTILAVCFVASIMGSTMAASTPSLGETQSFAILSSTYTNTVASTINGDVAYTTAPPVTPTINGMVFMPAPAQAGIDQGVALANLNSQGCDVNFAAGAIDLASDTTHGTIGVYEPNVYCINGAMSIGTSGIILSGAGTYVFRSIGALTTVVNSNITLSNGASTCDIFWTPVATTLGANSTFLGTVIDNAGITLGDNVARIGRALNFATTITTDNDTITVPTCSTQATLHVVKQVINDNGGTAISSLFALYVKRFGINVVGSPGSGTVSPGISYSLNAGTYTISENTNTSYTQSFANDCDASGSITLAAGDNKICTIINNDIAAPSGGGGGGGISIDYCPDGDYSPSYYDRSCGTRTIGITGAIIISTTNTAIHTGGISTTSTDITSGSTISESTTISTPEISPKFPKTGLEEENTTSWNILAAISALIFITSSSIIAFRKIKI